MALAHQINNPTRSSCLATLWTNPIKTFRNFRISEPTYLPNDPKYLVASSENNGLRKLNSLVIEKGLHAIFNLIESINQIKGISL